jgi:radical SAM-linked protein
VPIAFSQGFSPHPRISYANSAPTGTASEAEYVELAVTAPCDPMKVRSALDEALPPGLDVVDVVVAGTPDFTARLEASVWRIELTGVPLAVAAHAVQQFLAAERVEVQRLMKSGMRTFDARGAVVSMVAQEGDVPDCAILTAVVRHATPSVRPDDVLAAMRQAADLVPPHPPRVTRLAQGPLGPDDASVGDPLAPDREA